MLSNMVYPENDPHMKGSLVMKHYKDMLAAIPDSQLGKEVQEIKAEALEIADVIEKMKITDPRVLLKIYDVHKYQLPTIKDFI